MALLWYSRMSRGPSTAQLLRIREAATPLRMTLCCPIQTILRLHYWFVVVRLGCSLLIVEFGGLVRLLDHVRAF